MEIEVEPNVPASLLIPFAIHTAVLIFVHLSSLMLATCLLPELEAIGSTPHPDLYSYALIVAKSFLVQLCWVLSNIIGILLFLIELVLVAFIKFYPVDEQRQNNLHAATATLIVIMLLSLLMVPLIIYYSRSLSKYKIQLHERRLGQAQQMLHDINQQIATGPSIAGENKSTRSVGNSLSDVHQSSLLPNV